MGRKIVERDGVKLLEWDEQQLRYIAEIAERLPKEGAAKVAQDFWKRKIKDCHGRLWGRQKPKPFSRYRTPYQPFHRAAQMVSPHEAQEPVAAPLLRTGPDDAGAQAFSRGTEAEEVDTGRNGTAADKNGPP